MELTNTFLSKYYEINEAEKVLTITTREGMLFIKTLTEAEHEVCEKVKELFDTLSDEFKPQHNETKLLCKFLTLLSLELHKWFFLCNRTLVVDCRQAFIHYCGLHQV